MNILDKLSRESLRKGIPEFRPGDTVRVHGKIREGDKERVQLFEGVVIRRKRGGRSASFTVRKTSYGIGVERMFPLYSPAIEKIELVSRGKVRRARLTYLRKLSGKSARIKAEQWDEVARELADDTPAEGGEAADGAGKASAAAA